MKCRDLFCRREAEPGSPRCASHKRQFDERCACAADDLRRVKDERRAKSQQAPTKEVCP